MKLFFEIKFVIFLMFILQNSFAQERRIKVFEKKIDSQISLQKSNSNHLVVIPQGKKFLYIQVDQNKSWLVPNVLWDEWKELMDNTLVIVQSIEDEKQPKKIAAPLLLSNLTLDHIKPNPQKETTNYSILWSMNTLYPSDSSAQTSKKIEMNNCCENGTCSVLISVNKKNEKVYLISSR